MFWFDWIETAGVCENVALARRGRVRLHRLFYLDRQRDYATLVRLFRQSNKGVRFGFSSFYDLAGRLYRNVGRAIASSACKSFFARKKTFILEIVKKYSHYIDISFLLQ